MTPPLRVLVCGGRHYSGRQRVFAALDELHDDKGVCLIIEGGATGADFLAREWAMARGVPFKTYDAEWTTYGKPAGPIRNAKMLADGKPDMVLAFPGNRGTADMIAQATRAGVPAIRSIANA